MKVKNFVDLVIQDSKSYLSGFDIASVEQHHSIEKPDNGENHLQMSDSLKILLHNLKDLNLLINESIGRKSTFG